MFLSGEESSQIRPPTNMTLQQPETDADNADGRSGFGYSQKFFHISDGNLYSVFSPLQGRCYGVRPAFLRQHAGRSHPHRSHHQEPQQPSTEGALSNKESEGAPSVRGRGRGHRRGAGTPRGRRNRGLKFHNFVPAEKTGPIPAPQDGSSGAPWSSPLVHSECRLREEHGTKQITVSNYWASEGTPTITVQDTPTQDVEVGTQGHGLDLQGLMQSANVPPISPTESETSFPMKEDENLSAAFSCNPEKGSLFKAGLSPVPGRIHHRRKALQTRQVIPYTTYLSMLHDESPLDLSQATKSPPPPYYAPSRNPQGSTSTLEALLLSESNSNPRDQPSQSRLSASGSGLQPPMSVSRRPSQRTLIRQKLEDTFKQNGFLVKTKQVSDGDATFCKFKQLRKYTRYYLKSWHQHLPEEVHKLWKGFLPPSASPSGSAPLTRNSMKWTDRPS